MLLRQAQFKQIREHTYNNAITSLDLLLIFLAYHRSYNILLDVLIKTLLKFIQIIEYRRISLIIFFKFIDNFLWIKEIIEFKKLH